jgi:hypothetical protein
MEFLIRLPQPTSSAWRGGRHGLECFRIVCMVLNTDSVLAGAGDLSLQKCGMWTRRLAQGVLDSIRRARKGALRCTATVVNRTSTANSGMPKFAHLQLLAEYCHHTSGTRGDKIPRDPAKPKPTQIEGPSPFRPETWQTAPVHSDAISEPDVNVPKLDNAHHLLTMRQPLLLHRA